jgi:hypothetical protein
MMLWKIILVGFVLKNLFDENSVPRRDYKGYSKTHLDRIHFFVEKTSTVDLNASSENT